MCLDIGTGNGALSFYYTKKGSWTYFDINPDNLKIAQVHLKGDFEIVQDLVGALNAKRDLDRITIVDTLYYLPNQNEVLEACFSALKVGGEVVLIGVEFPKNDLLKGFRDWTGLNESTGEKNIISQKDLVTLLVGLGFTIESTTEFYGWFSQLLQTALDLFIRKEGKEGDNLTRSFTETEPAGPYYNLGLTIVGWLSKVTDFLDALGFWMPRYAYLLVAKKK